MAAAYSAVRDASPCASPLPHQYDPDIRQMPASPPPETFGADLDDSHRLAHGTPHLVDHGPDDDLQRAQKKATTSIAASDSSSLWQQAKMEMNTRSSSRHGARYHTLAGRARSIWLLEIICAIVGCCALGAIVGLLTAYDNRHLQAWHFYFSLNTVVSTLGTICKVALSEVLAASLSQFKWLWFTGRHRPLADFAAIEDASHGALGSASLLFSKRWRCAEL